MREEDRNRGGFSPHLTVLLQCQERAKRQGVGRWNKVSLNTDCHGLFHMRYIID